jgi:hypothetical protein
VTFSSEALSLASESAASGRAEVTTAFWRPARGVGHLGEGGRDLREPADAAALEHQRDEPGHRRVEVHAAQHRVEHHAALGLRVDPEVEHGQQGRVAGSGAAGVAHEGSEVAAEDLALLRRIGELQERARRSGERAWRGSSGSFGDQGSRENERMAQARAVAPARLSASETA